MYLWKYLSLNKSQFLAKNEFYLDSKLFFIIISNSFLILLNSTLSNNCNSLYKEFNLFNSYLNVWFNLSYEEKSSFSLNDLDKIIKSDS